jgi:hypothetical protein
MSSASATSLVSVSASRARQFYALTKPRVVQLIVFCAVIGMLLAEPGLPDWRLLLPAAASGSSPLRRQPSTAWSSSALTRAWHALPGGPAPAAS